MIINFHIWVFFDSHCPHKSIFDREMYERKSVEKRNTFSFIKN